MFLVLILYSYAKIFEIPYIGFDIHPSDGRVIGIYTEDQVSQLIQSGDRLLKAGAIDLEVYKTDIRQPLFERLQTGDVVLLKIQREDQEITVDWVVPGPTTKEILDRLDTLWLPYLFWIAGTATLLLVRPKDIRWRSLVAFYYMTALWLVTGLVSSGTIWHSAILMRMLIWLWVPVYLHLHWVFPRPLGNIPAPLSRGLYLGALGVACLEWFQLLPPPTYYVGLILALGGSLALLITHAIAQPDQRRDLKLLAVAFMVIVLPTIIIGTIGANLMGISLWYERGALLSLPAVPGAYFYVIYRRQLGGLELRANRIITLYILLILLFITFTLVFLFVNNWIEDRGVLISVEVILALIAGLTIAITYQNFQRFVERRLLGIPLPPKDLLETYASRITTSLDITGLVHLLRDEILPSLLIRQSALLRLNEERFLARIYATGIEEGGLPTEENLPFLVERSGRYLLPLGSDSDLMYFHWIRVVLPLEVGGKLIGLWLLGNRDPDDYYAQSEISALKAIANQTAIALVNITQAEHLHALYQADIERQEKERTRLAHGLHDEVLNQLAALSMHSNEDEVDPRFKENYPLIATYLRGVISDLRPAMLTYGLHPALEELYDQLSRRTSEGTKLHLDVPASEVRYDPKVEQHVFRILQQACENALRHAHARSICIGGDLEPGQLHLAVEDDGTGFPTGGRLDLNKLLIKGHYGLVGMYERAALIGAELTVDSAPERGTRISIEYRPGNLTP